MIVNDRDAEPSAQASGPRIRAIFHRGNTPMSADALSEVLAAVHLSGSIFFEVTAKSPWVAEAPPAARIAPQVAPSAQHAIEYHVVTAGSCWISLVGDNATEPVKLNEGDMAFRFPLSIGTALSRRI